MDSETKIDLKLEIGQCGRPTKAKTPCKQPAAHFFTPGCRLHCSPEELAMGRFISRVYWDARRAGREEGEQGAQEEINRLKKKVAKLQKEEEDRLLRHRVDGDQIVQVDGYAYRWSGDKKPLEVGEKVYIPCSYVDNIRGDHGFKTGTVTGLGTTFQGSLERVRSRQ